ncbi:hypothetical protein AK812_SmicGene2887 [Symbiodinium microadriaticum]|uniref:Uncharacterized protein n=1 Tax=Symbiodinium microadriaticum TaxID=2951 RepID=A0A1Q9F078_SYMMI|nr:hypothetical protein AK812_SmicGene2887 [Symbiodinium microadriaticum]
MEPILCLALAAVHDLQLLGKVHRIFSGSITEGAQVPELLWLQSQPELLYLTLKAFRLALKISIDWARQTSK